MYSFGLSIRIVFRRSGWQWCPCCFCILWSLCGVRVVFMGHTWVSPDGLHSWNTWPPQWPQSHLGGQHPTQLALLSISLGFHSQPLWKTLPLPPLQSSFSILVLTLFQLMFLKIFTLFFLSLILKISSHLHHVTKPPFLPQFNLIQN